MAMPVSYTHLEDFLREFLEAEGVVVAVEKEKQACEKEEGGGCYDEWNAFFHEKSSFLWGFYICMLSLIHI